MLGALGRFGGAHYVKPDYVKPDYVKPDYVTTLC